MDLDGFKAINDTMGHEIGDKLLVEIAGRLKECEIGENTIFRMGGDEFVLIMKNIQDIQEMEKMKNKIIEKMSREIIIQGNQCKIGISIGHDVFSRTKNIHKMLKKPICLCIRKKSRNSSRLTRVY
jgi:diguanylate cyclase (GGDEF)-like protein